VEYVLHVEKPLSDGGNMAETDWRKGLHKKAVAAVERHSRRLRDEPLAA
jgi:hypothetical protein